MKGTHLALCLLLATSAGAHAQTTGDPVAGQEKSAMCQGCHGPDGNSLAPQWPNLAGQGVKYIVKQLKDFQSGARKDPTMTSMVEGLSEQDMADIAAYFSQQKVQVTPVERINGKGRKLYVGGNRYTDVPSCAGCHGPNAVGNGPGAIPRLAGQKADYVMKALHDYRTESRTNDRNAIMQGVVKMMSDREIEAVAAYLAALER